MRPHDTSSNAPSSVPSDSSASPTLAGLSPETVRSILAFRDDRHWARFHEPKDLAIALSVEASELLNEFMWSGTDLRVETKKSGQAEELADVLIYAVLLADRLGLDLNDAVARKMAKNVRRYPVEAFRDEDLGEAARVVAERLRTEDRARCGAGAEGSSTGAEDAKPLIADAAPYRALLMKLETEGPDAAGGWKADSANRMMFAVYAPETVALWKQVEADAQAAGVAAASLDARRADPADARAALAQLLAAVETERRSDGAFLEAVKSGEVPRALEVIVREAGTAKAVMPTTTAPATEAPEVNGHFGTEASPEALTPRASRIGAGAPTLADDLTLLAAIEHDPAIAGREVDSPAGTFFIYAEDVNALRGRLAAFRIPNHWLALEAAGIRNPLEEAWARLPELDAEALRGVLTELLAAERDDSGFFARAAAAGRVRRLLEALAEAFRRGW